MYTIILCIHLIQIVSSVIGSIIKLLALNQINESMKAKSNTLKAAMIITLFSLAINLQGVAQSNKRVGIKGGLNVSNLFIDNVTDENARLGFHVGLFGQIFSSDVFAIQPELLYSTKGSKAHYSSGSLNQDVQYNLNYLDLPVLAVFKLGESVEIHAGAYASYLLNANISYKGDIANGADEIDKDNLSSYDAGLSGGLGFNFKAVQVGVRYNYGFVQIADSDLARTAIGNAKNSCAQVFLSINLGK